MTMLAQFFFRRRCTSSTGSRCSCSGSSSRLAPSPALLILMLHIEEVDLEAVVRSVLAPLQRQAAAKHVALDVRVHRPVIVEADEQQLSQVLLNLIDNGLRFTPEGGTVTVDLDVEDGYAKIVVSDTGIGIPYKDIPYIFERFFVADRSRARGVTGAGLGLSIVKQIVESHEGTITVESVLDAGTQFTIRIPMIARAS